MDAALVVVGRRRKVRVDNSLCDVVMLRVRFVCMDELLEREQEDDVDRLK